MSQRQLTNASGESKSRRFNKFVACFQVLKTLTDKANVGRYLVSYLKDEPKVHAYFVQALDPSRKCKFNSEHVKRCKPTGVVVEDAFEILKHLQALKDASRKEGAYAWNAILLGLPESHREAANAVLDQDIGVDLTLYNKVRVKLGLEPLAVVATAREFILEFSSEIGGPNGVTLGTAVLMYGNTRVANCSVPLTPATRQALLNLRELGINVIFRNQ